MEKRISMTREDLEGLLGEKIFDWQWEWVNEVLIRKQKPNLRVNKEDLTTNRPDMLSVLQEEMRKKMADHTKGVDYKL